MFITRKMTRSITKIKEALKGCIDIFFQAEDHPVFQVTREEIHYLQCLFLYIK